VLVKKPLREQSEECGCLTYFDMSLYDNRSMEPVTVTLRQDQIEYVDSLESPDGEASYNRSEAMRMVIDSYEDSQNLQAKVDDLRRQLTEANRRNEEVSDLAEYVDREKALQVEERERRRAPLLKRIEWLVFGYDGRR